MICELVKLLLGAWRLRQFRFPEVDDLLAGHEGQPPASI